MVKKWRTPPCTQEVKSFFGFVGYYQQFRHSFATIARLLNILSSSKVRFQRRKAERTGFQQLKRLLIEAPVFTYPDPARCYILDTCSSNAAAAAVLQQMVDGEERVVAGEERVVANYNQEFSSFQRNYYMTRSEFLAMVLTVTHLDRTYTDGSLGYGQTTHL